MAGRFLLARAGSLGLLFLLMGDPSGHADYLQDLEEDVGREESAAQTALAARLETLERLGRENLVEAAISAPLLGRLFQELEGVSFRFKPQPDASDEVEVSLVKLHPEFRDGFPRVSAEGRAQFRDKQVEVAVRMAVWVELGPGQVVVKLKCLGISFNGLPEWVAATARVKATEAANAALDRIPIVLPLRSTVEVPFTKPGQIELPIRTPNGQVFIGINLPQPPPLKRWVQPREVFFSQDALHVLIEPRSSQPAEVPTELAPAVALPSSVTAEELERRLAPWRLASDLSYSVRVGRAFLTGLLTEVNTWKPEERTVKMQGLRASGHLLDRTGGPPFGNGFRAWLDGPRRLHGEVSVSEFKPGWEPSHQQIPLTLKVAASGGGQIHVHGNAPHIDPPRIFGRRIGGGATIGGGVGTSVGITLRQESVPTLSAVAQLTPDTGHFEVRLLEPGDLIFKVEAGGIPTR